MSLLERVSLDRLTPLRLWEALDGETRLAAARALYRRDWGEPSTRREADLSIAAAMRFRDAAVRQLPVDRRAQYLAKVRIPTDSLASSLLMALHLEERAALLGAFLDALGIPHRGGLIDEDHEVDPPTDEAIARAAAGLFAGFPSGEVETYLASLVAMDAETWAGAARALESRKKTPAGS
jgi:hypothetical protein